MLSPPEDISQLVPPPPAVHAGPSGSFPAGHGVALVGSAIDEHVATTALTLQWSKRSGPGTVRFAKPHALSTKATFSEPGVYVLRLSASNGSQTGFADTTLTIVGAPVAAAKVAHAARG